MKIIIAPDSFKGCLSAREVADAIEGGVKRAAANCETLKIPMADGGEGTVDSLVMAEGGSSVHANVFDPLGREISARFGILADSGTAIVEMAAASGLPLLKSYERNPLKTTSYGTGQLILAAVDKNCDKIIVGLGGSATVDCGAGMLQALGAKLLRDNGKPLPAGCAGGVLNEVKKIETSQIDNRLYNCEFIVAVDVKNCLLGKEGAARIYAPQKGASQNDVLRLENNLSHFVSLIEKTTGKSVRNLPGSGAAGGIGAAIYAFFNSNIKPGIEVVIEFTQFREKLADADLVITGEGQLDYQTIYGKTCAGMAHVAAAAGVPVAAIVGSIKGSIDKFIKSGLSKVISLEEIANSRRESFSRAKELIKQAAEMIVLEKIEKK